jgi:starch-binding outer membrane protein, SusD/RagB family
MKILKNIFIICVIASFSTACTNLDETIYSDISAEKTTFSSSDINAMIAPAYSDLRSVYWGWNGLFDTNEESCDLMMTPLRIGVGWGDLYITMHKHTYNSYTSHFYTLWYNAYNGISSINKLLDMSDNTVVAPNVPELRGLRALYYYIMFDNFRNIPLETTLNHVAGYLPTQAAPDTTFNFIVSELNAVKGELSDTVSTATYGHFNKYAACMTLAKMYLNHNAWLGGTDKVWYQKAIDEVNTVIKSGKYSLDDDYTDLFVDDLSSNSEVIFGLPFKAPYATGNYCVNKCLAGPSAATFGYTGTPWNGSCAVPQFVDTYNSDDERFKDTWLIGPQYSLDGVTPVYLNGVQLNYTKKVHSIDNPGAYQYEGARFHKYKIYANQYGTSEDDVPFYRLTDAYMIKAECLLRLGGYNGETEQDAADIVSTIRRRAFKNNPDKAIRTVAELKGPSVYSYGHQEYQLNTDGSDKLVETYEGGNDVELGGFLDDLAWEFVGEHHRRQDLIRFRLTDKNMNVYDGKSWFCKDAETNASDIHKDIYPIYQDFIDANKNLKQNSGY